MASHFHSDTQPKRSRLPIIIPCVLVGVLALVYLGGVLAFHQVFMPNTTLNGQDVSLRAVKDVAAEKSDSMAGYQLHVTGDGVDLTVSAQQIGLSHDGEAYAQEAVDASNPWAWPAALAGSRELSVESPVTFDREALLALFAPARQAAEESAASLGGSVISYDAESNSFAIDPSITARYLNDDALVEVLSAAFTARSETVELGPEQLSGMDDAIHAARDAANAYLAAAPSALVLDGENAREISSELIAGWVVVGDDLSVSLDAGAVTAWVDEAVGSLNTIGAERTYTRPDGKQVSVSGGSYGWKVDAGEAAEALVAALGAGTPQTVEVAYKTRGQVVPDAGGRDWGARYIDIDLTEQHVRMYGDDGSLIWESDCVTGDTSQGYDTPTGVNEVNGNMGRDQTLYGLDYNEDGEPDYESHVAYWIPFVGNMVALHDADWRSSFGGNIYQWNGSHGCVNLPVDKTAELYGLVKIGDVVVVHY